MPILTLIVKNPWRTAKKLVMLLLNVIPGSGILTSIIGGTNLVNCKADQFAVGGLHLELYLAGNASQNS